MEYIPDQQFIVIIVHVYMLVVKFIFHFHMVSKIWF